MLVFELFWKMLFELQKHIILWPVVQHSLVWEWGRCCLRRSHLCLFFRECEATYGYLHTKADIWSSEKLQAGSSAYF
uniref:Uncharacterized protein n=1 Tax=Arundo donax TaxID=35708 RepID=A0A0A9F6T5_ARUDO